MTYQFAKLNGNASFSPGNFFSFFTIQSNILAASMLVLTALVRVRRAIARLLRRRARRR